MHLITQRGEEVKEYQNSPLTSPLVFISMSMLREEDYDARGEKDPSCFYKNLAVHHYLALSAYVKSFLTPLIFTGGL